MNDLQTNEAAKLWREILMRVGNDLADYYGDVLKEAIPYQFTKLVRRLVTTTEVKEERLNREPPISKPGPPTWLTEGSATQMLHIAHGAWLTARRCRPPPTVLTNF
jgi:hypothetical protein